LAEDAQQRAADVGAPDFGAVFQALANPHMVLDREFRYVEVNRAYCETTERSREEFLGRHVFDLLPNEGPSGAKMLASLQRVLETGQPDSIPLLAYPIPLPKSRSGRFEMRFWSTVQTPVLGRDGRTEFIIQNAIDVTNLQKLKQLAFGASGVPDPGEAVIFQRASEVEAANEALQKETEWLISLFQQAPGFISALAAPDLRIALANDATQQLIGHRQIVGRTFAEALPELAAQGYADLAYRVLQTREPYIGKTSSARLQRTPGGPLEERFVDFVYQPIFDAAGEASGVFVAGFDVTDRVQAEEQQKLLVDELNHRVKNTLATVQAIAAQTLRTTPEPAAFAQAFEARLMALSATHELLNAADWRSAALRDVVEVELNPYGGDRFCAEGPDVALAATEALALGLIFHELATNAAKYGSLSRPGGRVTVCWSLDRSDPAANCLELVWRETGGPTVGPPTRRGYGTRLIERSLGSSATSSLEFAPEGVVCRISLRLLGAPSA